MRNLFSLTTLNLIKTTCISMIKDYPMFCRLELTSKCNFRCEFCHIHRRANIDEDMTTKQILEIIDVLAYIGISFLYITGGEPLIREDIEDILKYAKNKNMYILLGTNGSLFKQKFNKINRYIDNVHFSIQSVNNFENITGSTKKVFEEICDGIKLALKVKIPTQINVIIDKNNISEMFDIFKFINNSFPNVNIMTGPMELLSSNAEDNKQMEHLLPDINLFNEQLYQIKRLYNNINTFDNDIKCAKDRYILKNKEFCKAGKNIFVVNHKGELEYPCEFIRLKTMKANSRSDIKNFFKTRKEFSIDIKQSQYCKNCLVSCYLQPSYFLTFKGFVKIIFNFIKQ